MSDFLSFEVKDPKWTGQLGRYSGNFTVYDRQLYDHGCASVFEGVVPVDSDEAMISAVHAAIKTRLADALSKQPVPMMTYEDFKTTMTLLERRDVVIKLPGLQFNAVFVFENDRYGDCHDIDVKSICLTNETSKVILGTWLADLQVGDRSNGLLKLLNECAYKSQEMANFNKEIENLCLEAPNEYWERWENELINVQIRTDQKQYDEYQRLKAIYEF